MSILIKQAENFAVANDLTQVIIFGHDGKETQVVTWGDTVEHAAQAAAGANAIKKQWGWPADTIAESAKVTALKEENERLKLENEKMQALFKRFMSAEIFRASGPFLF